MICILSGNDFKKKNAYVKIITKNYEINLLSNDSISKDSFNELVSSQGLFGKQIAIISENILSKNDIVFSEEELESLKNSQTLFIFIEDKLLITQEKKYKKYADIQKFDDKRNLVKTNNFVIAEAFSNRNKIKTWMLYRQAIDSGIEPEMISGMLFWKIKTMILNGTRLFTKQELKLQSSNIVSLYHKAHRGELDFIIGLEQFILSSLSK